MRGYTRFLRFLLATSVLACLHVAANAQWKPDRLVTIVVPFNPGGGADALVRPIAAELSRIWGQPVIVENRPGAETAIGTRRVMEAKPDGYTLLLQVPSVTLFKHLPAFKGFDPMSALVPVTALSIQSPGFVVNAKIPGKTLADVLRYCKTAERPCTFGTTENFSRLQSKAIADEAGLKNAIMVRYKGTGQLITDLLTNNVNMAVMGLTVAIPHQRSGALKILAVHSNTRSTALPDVPTTAEAGFPMFNSEVWYGLFAPKGTSPETLDAVTAAVREALKADAVRKGFATIAAEPVGNTPREFAASVQASDQYLGDLIRRFPLDE